MGTGEIGVEIKLRQSGKMEAFANVTMNLDDGEVTMSGFRVFRNEDGSFWVAFPANSFVKDGKQKNIPILEFPRSLKKKITDAVLTAFEEAREGL